MVAVAAVPAGAATVYLTFGLTRQVEACWEQDGVLHYRASGETYDARQGLWADEVTWAVARTLAEAPEALIVVSDAPPGSHWIPPGRSSGRRPGSIPILIIRGR